MTKPGDLGSSSRCHRSRPIYLSVFPAVRIGDDVRAPVPPLHVRSDDSRVAGLYRRYCFSLQ